LAWTIFRAANLRIDERRSRPRAKSGRFHFVKHGASRRDSGAIAGRKNSGELRRGILQNARNPLRFGRGV
jgi:hypothetical protein